MIRVADDIYTWRVVYRLTQRDAADLVPVSERTWRRWEAGTSHPGEDHYNTLRWLIAQPPPGWIRPDQSAEGVELLHDELADQPGR